MFNLICRPVLRTPRLTPTLSLLPAHARFPTPRLLTTSPHSTRPTTSSSSSRAPPHNALTRHGTCPNCHAPYGSPLPICANCGAIQAIGAETNFFELFELPSEGADGAFDLDPRVLRSKFLQLQRACHPDAWGNRGEVDKQRAADQSSLLNRAYRTLQSPLSRAQYLLSLHGFSSLETDSLDEQSSALLMEVLEAREQVEGAAGEEELLAIREENAGRVSETVRELSGRFAKGEWEEAKEVAVRLRYWEGIEDAVREKLSG